MAHTKLLQCTSCRTAFHEIQINKETTSEVVIKCKCGKKIYADFDFPPNTGYILDGCKLVSQATTEATKHPGPWPESGAPF